MGGFQQETVRLFFEAETLEQLRLVGLQLRRERITVRKAYVHLKFVPAALQVDEVPVKGFQDLGNGHTSSTSGGGRVDSSSSAKLGSDGGGSSVAASSPSAWGGSVSVTPGSVSDTPSEPVGGCSSVFGPPKSFTKLTEPPYESRFCGFCERFSSCGFTAKRCDGRPPAGFGGGGGSSLTIHRCSKRRRAGSRSCDDSVRMPGCRSRREKVATGRRSIHPATRRASTISGESPITPNAASAWCTRESTISTAAVTVSG